MIPIGTDLPTDTGSFRSVLAKGLEPLALGNDAIKVEGEFPQFASIQANLSGARLHKNLPFTKASGSNAQPLCFARSARISGQPVHVANIPLSVSLEAEDVVIDTDTAADSADKVLTLGKMSRGTLDLSAQRSTLEDALFALGDAAAKSKGAELQKVELQFENESPRQVRIRAVITAKAMFFTTTVTVSGKLSVDDALNARISNLDCEGDGMIGKMAANALRSQFEQLESRVIPLAKGLGGVAITDVALTGGETLRIHAKIGASA